MSPVNPISDQNRIKAGELYCSIPGYGITSPGGQDAVEKIAQALANARSEGYIAGVEDAVRIARKHMLTGVVIANAILKALLGPK